MLVIFALISIVQGLNVHALADFLLSHTKVEEKVRPSWVSFLRLQMPWGPPFIRNLRQESSNQCAWMALWIDNFMHWSNTISLASQGFLNDGVGDSIFEVNSLKIVAKSPSPC